MSTNIFGRNTRILVLQSLLGLFLSGMPLMGFAQGHITGQVDGYPPAVPAIFEVDVLDATNAVLVATISTNDTGLYDSGPLPAGDYKVRFTRPGYLPAYVGATGRDSDSFDLGTPVTVLEGQTTVVNESLSADPTPAKAVPCFNESLFGRITDAGNGMPLANIQVSVVFSYDAMPVASTSTDETGSFFVPSTFDSCFEVKVRFSDPTASYLPEYFGANGQDVFTLGSAVDWKDTQVDVSTSMVPSSPPIASAGPNQTVHVGSLVILDGSGSSDPGGFVPLTYAWSFGSQPAGSAASLSNPAAVDPTFTADLPGNYGVQLIVTDSRGAASQPATVTISTTNTAPLASAGSDQAVTLIGSTIKLDGSSSYDLDGDPITYYQWSFVSIPTGSAAKLSNPNIVNPTFTADVHGTYVAQLVVRDPWSQSTPSQVTISFENVRPVADAGTGQSAIVGDAVALKGTGSSDANGDPLTYQWSFASVPAGSYALIASPTFVITTFVPDLPGTYIAQLIVNDGLVNSDPSTVQVQVVTTATAAVQETKAIQNLIASLDPSVLKNASMQNALINKLNAVLANIAAGHLASALDQLQNDILRKTDGCATTGAADKNDWIKTCDEQNEVYPYLMQLIQLVQSTK